MKLIIYVTAAVTIVSLFGATILSRDLISTQNEVISVQKREIDSQTGLIDALNNQIAALNTQIEAEQRLSAAATDLAEQRHQLLIRSRLETMPPAALSVPEGFR